MKKVNLKKTGVDLFKYPQTTKAAPVTSFGYVLKGGKLLSVQTDRKFLAN